MESGTPRTGLSAPEAPPGGSADGDGRPSASRGALTYLWRDRDEAVTTVVIGGILTFFSFLLVPQVVVLGYVVRLLRAVDRDEGPPTFGDLRGLLVDGVRAYVIWLAWTFVPLAVDWGLNGGRLRPGQATLWLLGWVFAPGPVSRVAGLGVERTSFFEWYASWEPYVVLLVVLYLLPGAMANFARRGTLRAGFFDDGLRRQADWWLGHLGAVAPTLSKLLERVVGFLLGDDEFTPDPRLRTGTYLAGWAWFFAFYLLAEGILRLFVYLPTLDGLGWINLLYLVAALPAYFVLRVAGWVVVGRAWGRVTAGTDAAPPGDGTGVGRGTRAPIPARNGARASARTSGPLGRRVGVPGRTLLAGGLLASFGYLIVPGLLVAGYLLRVLRTTDTGAADGGREGEPPAGDEPPGGRSTDGRASARRWSPPTFAGVRSLLADGVRAYAVWFAYAVVPLGLLSVPVLDRLGPASGLTSLAVWGAISGIGLPGGFPTLYLGLGAAVLALVPLLVAILVAPGAFTAVTDLPLVVSASLVLASAYVVPAALVAVARNGSVRAAFGWGVFRTLWRRAYARAVATATLLTLVGWAAVLGSFLFVGHPVLAGVALVEPVAGLDALTFVSAPTSVLALGFWIALLGSSLLYFALLVVACRLVARAVPPAPPAAADSPPAAGSGSDGDHDDREDDRDAGKPAS